VQQTMAQRADRIVSHVQEEAQLQGKIQLEEGQSDIARIISVTASVVPDEVEMLTDALEFAGRLIFEVLYVSVDAPDDVAVLRAESQFRHSMQAQGAQSGMHTYYVVQVEDVEEVLENPRTIALTADVEFDVWVIETCDIDTLPETGDLQVKKKSFAAVETLERQTQIIPIEKQVQLPSRAPAIGQVLSAQGIAVVRDVTGTVEGTHVDGELTLFIPYDSTATETHDGEFYTTNFVIPFGFDLEWEQRGMGENASVVLALDEITATAAADEMGEYRLVDIDAKIIANAALWQETELELPCDAYLPGHNVKVETASMQLKKPPIDKCTQRMLRFGVTLPSGYPKMEQVLFMRARPVVRSSVAQDEATLVVGTLLCDIVYRAQGEESAIYGFHASIPFEERIAAACDQTLLIHAWCMQSSCDAVDGLQADCRVQLELCATCMADDEVSYICQVTDEGAVQDQSAIVMSVATANDDLWSIAKRFNVSMDAVLAANPKYENKPLCVGDKVILYRRIVF